jgi:hypothetical protein
MCEISYWTAHNAFAHNNPIGKDDRLSAEAGFWVEECLAAITFALRLLYHALEHNGCNSKSFKVSMYERRYRK